jgi:hypothetical protein
MNEVRSPSEFERKDWKNSAMGFHVLGPRLARLLRPKPSFSYSSSSSQYHASIKHAFTRASNNNITPYNLPNLLPHLCWCFFLPHYGPAVGRKRAEHPPRLVLGLQSLSHQDSVTNPLSLTTHPSGIHEQRTRTRLISAAPHETYYTRPAEATAHFRYPCLLACQRARMNILTIPLPLSCACL